MGGFRLRPTGWPFRPGFFFFEEGAFIRIRKSRQNRLDFRHPMLTSGRCFYTGSPCLDSAPLKKKPGTGTTADGTTRLGTHTRPPMTTVALLFPVRIEKKTLPFVREKNVA